jgi:hypothetical protein
MQARAPLFQTTQSQNVSAKVMNSTSSKIFVAAVLIASGCATKNKVARPESIALRSGERAVQVLAENEIFARVTLSKSEPASIEALFSHGGRHVLRGFPLQPRSGESVDHPEHLSMWTAHRSVSGYNLWSDATGPRLQDHSLRMRADGQAVIDMDLHWSTPDAEVLCVERRSYSFQSTDQVRIVDVLHRLTAPGEAAIFGDVREGFFALRLQDRFRLDRGDVRVVTSLKVEGQDPYGLPARWIAYTAQIPDGVGDLEDVTVCIFDRPSNPGYPARWFARPYGLVAANPFAETAFDAPESITTLTGPEGFRIEAYQSESFLYRVAIARGELSGKEIEALWKEFVSEPDPAD